MNIQNKLVEAFYKIKDNFLKNNNSDYRKLHVVIQMQPKTFMMLTQELAKENKYIYLNRGLNCAGFIELCGRKTPIIINSKLDKNTEFIMQTQFDYERMEQEKLMK